VNVAFLTAAHVKVGVSVVTTGPGDTALPGASATGAGSVTVVAVTANAVDVCSGVAMVGVTDKNCRDSSVSRPKAAWFRVRGRRAVAVKVAAIMAANRFEFTPGVARSILDVHLANVLGVFTRLATGLELCKLIFRRSP
jgi:hypothetical protein